MRVKIKIRTKKKTIARLKKPGYWLAMGTVAACATTGAGPATLLAQQATPQGPEAAQALPVVQFDIPAGQLGDALAQFERASGWKVDVPEAGMRSLPARAVSGSMPAGQALRQMLAGSSVTFELTGPGAARLRLRDLQTSVEIFERAPVTSPRYTEPLRNLPQTISVIPKEIISQQAATSLTDVLRNVPGLTITAGEGGVPGGDNLTIRGNSARNDIFVDGVRDLSPQSRDPFNFEQVEVTKGPTSAVSGRGSAGGTINLVSKGPGIGRILGGSFALGNAGTSRGTLDINTNLKRLGLGERTAFRLNLLGHDAGVPGRNAVKNSRWGVAPSLGFGLGTPTRLTLNYYKLKQDNIADYGIPWIPATNNALAAYRDRPAPVPRETFYGFANRDREVLNQDTGTVKVEHDFSDTTQLRSQFRYGKAGRNSIATPPRLAGVDTTTINREMRSWIAQDSIWDSQTDLRAEANTFGIRHALVTGLAVTRERNRRILRTAANSPTTLLNPNPADVYTGEITVNPNVGLLTGNTQAGWLFDTMKFGQHWEATGGLRYERFDVDGISTTPAPVRQTVTMPTIRAGLVYKPTDRGSLYASYGSSQSPSLEGLSYNTSNTTIPPEKTFTTEVGTKWEVAGNRLLLSGAVFRVAKDNARTPGLLPTDPPQVLAGLQVSQGVEFSASGAITRSIRILTAYTFLNARIRSSNNAAEVGKFFQNTPRNSANVWLTYTARKFTAGVGPRFMGKRYGNNTNTRQVDGFGTVDGMVSYRAHKNLDLQLNLSNIGDAYYFDRLGGGHLVPAAGRYVLFTTNFHF
jgi:catecholate siderophore receptor